MPINQKDVELLIRARNLSSQPLKEVTDSVNGVTKALGEQIAAAERGDISAAELNETLKKLKNSEDALVKQSALIDRMRTLSEQLATAERNVIAAKEAVDNFTPSTAKAAERLAALREKFAAAQEKVKQTSAALAEYQAKLSGDNVSDAEAAKITKLTAARDKAVASAQRASERIVIAEKQVAKAAQEEQAAVAKAYERAQEARNRAAVNAGRQGERLSGLGISATPDGLDAASASIYGGVAQTSAAIKEIEAAQSDLAVMRRKAAEAAKEQAAAEKVLAEAAREAARVAEESAKAEAEAEREYQAALARSDAAKKKSAEEGKAFYAQMEASRRKFREAEYAALFDARDAAEAKRKLDIETAGMERQNGVRDRLIRFLNTERGARILAAEAKRKETEATQTNTDAENKNHEAREKSRSSLSLFNNDSRESLSLYQRLRGQVLAIAATYVGLQGAIDLARGALEALVDKQAAENRLAIVVGNDPKKIGDEYAYVHDQAVRLGMGIKEMADSYSNFAIAAKNGNLNLEQTRFAFERITEAMRVNHASSDAVNGAFAQLEQMLSKNKVQMDDLRQASSWIPGMEAMMARGLANKGFSGFEELSGTLEKMKTVEPEKRVAVLFKAMREGGVDAKLAIMALAEELERVYKDRLPDALKSLQAEQGRLNTAFFDFKLAIADAGFADAATKLFQRLTEALKGEQGAEFARKISDGFSKLADITIWLVSHLDDLLAVLKLILELKMLQWSMSFASGLKKLTERLIEVSGQAVVFNNNMKSFGLAVTDAQKPVGALNKALFAIRTTLAVVGAAITGWQIGTWLSEKFDVVRLAGISLVSGLMDLWTNIRYGVQIGIYSFVLEVQTAFDKLQAMIAKVAIAAAQANPMISSQAVDQMREQTALDQNQRTAMIGRLASRVEDAKSARDKEINERHDQFQQMFEYEAAGGDKGAAARAAAQATANPPGSTASPGDFGKTGLGLEGKEKGAQQRAAMEEALANQLRAIDAKIERQQKDSLDTRLKAVDDTYQRIYDKLAKFQQLGGKTIKVTDENGADRVLTIEQYKEQLRLQTDLLKKQEEEKFNKEKVKTLEDDFNKLLAERKDRLAAIADDLKSGAVDSSEAFRRTSAVFDEMNPKIADAAKKAKDFANASVGRGVTASQAGAFNARAGNATDFNTAERKQALILVGDGEARINDLINQRKAIIEANNALVQLGLMTQRDADAMLEKENAKLGPQIKKQADQLLAVIEEMHDAGKLTNEDFDLLTAKISAARAQSEQLSEAMTWTKNFIDSETVKGATTFFQGIAEGIAGIVTNTKSWGDAWRDLRTAMLGYFADLLMQLGLEIIKRQILNALQAASSSTSGGWVGALATVVSSMFHGGGTVGASAGMSRSASPAWFVNAPSYHNGGLPGLASDEEAAILKHGEEVLTKEDPRNVLNGGKAAAGAGSATANPQNIKIINSIDSHSVLEQALSTQDGARLILNTLRANRSQLKVLLNN